MAFVGIDRCAFRVGDQGADITRGLRGTCRKLYGFVGRYIPWVVQIKIGEVGRDQIGVGEPRCIVFGSVAGNVPRCFGGLP